MYKMCVYVQTVNNVYHVVAPVAQLVRALVL
jgi:hypothetical protein